MLMDWVRDRKAHMRCCSTVFGLETVTHYGDDVAIRFVLMSRDNDDRQLTVRVNVFFLIFRVYALSLCLSLSLSLCVCEFTTCVTQW